MITAEQIRVDMATAGDPNSRFSVELPPDAIEAVMSRYANELRLARLEIKVACEPGAERELDVEALLSLQGELDRARTATDVLLRGRPAEEWEE